MPEEAYLFPDYCSSCAYFKQTKGNFGICTVIPEKPPYDGTRKFSSCRAWRIRTDLIVPYLRRMLTPEPPQRVRGIPEEKIYGIKGTGVYRVRVYDGIHLPQYTRFKYHYDIIDRAVRLFEKGKDTGEIREYLKQYADINVDRKTIKEWIFEFLGVRAWHDAHKRTSLPCTYCSSNNTVKNGKTKTGKTDYKCKDCKKRFSV